MRRAQGINKRFGVEKMKRKQFRNKVKTKKRCFCQGVLKGRKGGWREGEGKK